jgi:hypothetical protein
VIRIRIALFYFANRLRLRSLRSRNRPFVLPGIPASMYLSGIVLFGGAAIWLFYLGFTESLNGMRGCRADCGPLSVAPQLDRG